MLPHYISPVVATVYIRTNVSTVNFTGVVFQYETETLQYKSQCSYTCYKIRMKVTALSFEWMLSNHV